MGKVRTIGINSLSHTDYPQPEEKQTKVTGDQLPGTYHVPLWWKMNPKQSANNKMPWLGFYFLSH